MSVNHSGGSEPVSVTRSHYPRVQAEHTGNDGEMSDYDEDPSNLLILTYAPDADGTGRLLVKASANGFAGEASAWFNDERIADFATALSAYPLQDATISLASGFGASEAQLEQEHVRIEVQKVGTKGQLGVRIHLATPEWKDTRPESVDEVRLELLTTYERIRHFSDELLALVRGQVTEAHLGAEVLI